MILDSVASERILGNCSTSFVIQWPKHPYLNCSTNVPHSSTCYNVAEVMAKISRLVEKKFLPPPGVGPQISALVTKNERTCYCTCALDSSVFHVATRPYSMAFMGTAYTEKIDAIFFPVIAVIIEFIVPSASWISAIRHLNFNFFQFVFI